MNHGNALSIYFNDPEDNVVEAYLDTRSRSANHGDPLDLDLPDSTIWAQTETICRADPTFAMAADWAAEFSERSARMVEADASFRRLAVAPGLGQKRPHCAQRSPAL
jgi:catechol 2,3-dioxygenase